MVNPNHQTSVLIGGDLYTGGRNENSFKSADASALFHDLLEEFEAADLTIVNLEAPLVSVPSPLSKYGPHLRADPACAKGIRSAGIDVVGLANNHILDHGTKGLRATLQACAAEGILTFGGGEDLVGARRILVQEVNNLRIGILGMAEHEFSIATREHGGANPLDLIDFIRNVRIHKHTYDYLIVLLHGGNEHYPYPRPELQDTCRFLVEEGANAVICQHSHCPGTYETYRDGHIVYGQGNLIFDAAPSSPAWDEGFLVKLTLDGEGRSRMNIIPHSQKDTATGAKRMRGVEEQVFCRELEKRLNVLRDENLLHSCWKTFCEEKRREYLIHVLGGGKFRRLLLRSFPLLLEWTHSEKALLLMRAIIQCESHRELLLDALRNHDSWRKS